MKTVDEMATILRSRGLLKGVMEGAKSGDTEITWLTCDSRKVIKGTLFICKGARFRMEYLQDAAKSGCVAYISENCMDTEPKLTGLIVTDIRKAMAVASAAFFEYCPGNPALTGITGTKGKTTTSWYLKAMLDAWAKERNLPETGLISTVENYDGSKREDAVMTTPEAPTLHEFLHNAHEAGLSHVTMEVSSQALKYKRVRELRFQVGIFLNISEDHISPQEHQDFEDYFNAKLSIFRQTEIACVNLDSDYAQRIMRAARKSEKIVTFGTHPDADLHCSEVVADCHQISFKVTCDRFSERFVLGMRGSFNIENAMAAITAAYVYGVPVSCMKEALAQTRVPGRMETFVSRDGNVCGVVDYAHNRLSFERLFDAVFQEYKSYKKIITVFGCPGGKAFNRRKELGVIAGLFSDYVCVTSDDPGMECPQSIAGEVREFVELTGCCCHCIEDREEAVRHAVDVAYRSEERTLILVLGKGSEKYQKVGLESKRYPTDACLLKTAIQEHDLEKYQNSQRQAVGGV